jgi:hypothetical protein
MIKIKKKETKLSRLAYGTRKIKKRKEHGAGCRLKNGRNGARFKKELGCLREHGAGC